MAIPFGIYETSHWRVLHVSRELAISVREISSLWFKKINKYWDLLQLSNKASVNSVHAYKLFWHLGDQRIYVITLCAPLLLIGPIIFLKHVTRRRCSNCKNIIKADVFTSNRTQESFKMRYSTDCTSQNVIYLIECKRCNMQYIGQTNQQVSKQI